MNDCNSDRTFRLQTTRPPVPRHGLNGLQTERWKSDEKEEHKAREDRITGRKREKQQFRSSGTTCNSILPPNVCITQLTQRLNISAESRTCSWLHFLGIQMKPRKELVIDQILIKAYPRIGFWFFLFASMEETQECFPPLSTEKQALQSGQ